MIAQGQEWWRAHVDGGCNPNPEGVMGLGVHLVDPAGHDAARLSERPGGRGTSNTAEYHGVLRALEEAKRQGAKRLEVVADSRLTVGTLSGRMQARAPHLVALVKRIRVAEAALDEVKYRWVPREQNKVADTLASLAIEEKTGRKRGGGRSGSAGSAGSAGAGAEPSAGKGKVDGIRCGLCGQESLFRWQTFRDGSKHLRQECLTHGFLRYAPKEKEFVGRAKDN